MTDAARADVAVVIVNYRTPELTKRCLAALAGERETLPKLRAVVVDGGSGDRSAQNLSRTVTRPEYRDWVSFLPLTVNGGFGWANNQAILTLAREGHAFEYIYLLNPDAEPKKGAVASLVEELERHPSCAAAGSRLLDEHGGLVPSAFRFPSPGREFVSAAQSETVGRMLRVASTVVKTEDSADVDWVTGASVMLRTAALHETGLFDDGFFLYFEEVELMHRLHAHGWTVRHVPASVVTHLEGAATGAGSAGVRPMPSYWYRSRHRYFALTRGPAGVFAANLARIAGQGVAVLKTVVKSSQRKNRIRLAEIIRASSGGAASVPRWGDAPGKLPVWIMRP
nr:glycosyltransferase family 2 protein [Sphingomonas sp.]